MDNEKYRSPEWQENKLKELYYAFGTSEEEGLKLFLNLVLELRFENPSFLEKVYNAIEEIQQEGVYEVTNKTLNWLKFWKSYDPKDETKNPYQLKKLTLLKDADYLTKENLGRLYFKIGFIHDFLGNHKRAARSYSNAICLLPDWAWAYNNLGIALSEAGKKDKAVKCLNKAVQLDQKLAQAFYNLGVVYNKQGLYEQAFSAFKKVLNLQPDDFQTYYNLGCLQEELGHISEAIDAYQKAIKLNFRFEQAYSKLINIYQKQGYQNRAIKLLRKVIELNPNEPQYYFILGVIYSNLAKYRKALVAFKKAIDLDPKNEVAYNNLGAILGKQNSYEKAIIAYKKAIEINPQNAAPHNGLGFLFLKQGKYNSAKKHLEKAIFLDTNAYVAIVNLGITYFHLKDRKKAHIQFRSAVEKCPLNSVFGRLNKVTALLGLERNEEALHLLQQTKENFKISPGEKEGAFTDWHLLANSPEPPAGIGEFLERAREILGE